MAADFQAVAILAQMIGVVDGPARQPEHLLSQFAQDGVIVGHGPHYGCFTPAVPANINLKSSQDWSIPLIFNAKRACYATRTGPDRPRDPRAPATERPHQSRRPCGQDRAFGI